MTATDGNLAVPPGMLTSIKSPRVAAVRRLHRRPARRAERRFLVEGPQAVREALTAGGLVEVFATDLDSELVRQAHQSGTPVTRVTADVLRALAETVTPQGLVGVASTVDVPLDRLPPAPRLVAVLEAVNDPGNAGTILRTADAAGADAVVLTHGSTDPHGGKCVRASAGSLWHLPVVSGSTMPDTLDALRARGLQVLATTGRGADDLDVLADDGSLAAPTAWVFGTEAHGLTPQVLAAADRRVRVPMHGRAESLNLAATAAICLFASARALRGRRPPT